jgi:hypothetical protein
MRAVPDSCIVLVTRSREGHEPLAAYERACDLPWVVIDDSINPSLTRVPRDVVFSKESLPARLPRELLSLCQLGKGKWNLGRARNAGLAVARLLGFERAVFVDDDIDFESYDIAALLRATEETPFAGAIVSGKPDLSEVDRVFVETGGVVEDCVSGGFLAVRLEAVSHHFLNHYNEDLIWLNLHRSSRPTALSGQVSQIGAPLVGRGRCSAAQWQEFGEVLLLGVVEARREDSFSLLEEPRFWRDQLVKEGERLSGLASLCHAESEDGYVIDAARIALAEIDPDGLAQTWVQYELDNDVWNRGWERLSRPRSQCGA